MFSHTIYESTDFVDRNQIHSFVSNLHEIPKPSNYYDVIICTQVLEHVEYPQRVIEEFNRVLKPGGKLFLTAPQGWGIHGAPYHFFHFTNYGLKLLFENAKFNIVSINPRGGIFWYLGKRIRVLPSYIFKQNRKNLFLALLISPFYLISIPICEFIIPFLFFYLDKLDIKKDFTLGYECICQK